MNKELSVLVDAMGELASIDTFHEVIIYTKKRHFEIERRCLCTLHKGSLEEIRNSIALFMELLGECHIIISKEITGVPFHVLSKNQYIMCEADQFSDELLEQVYEDYCMNNETISSNSTKTLDKGEVKDNVILLKPINIAPKKLDEEGNYYINIIEIQKEHPQISTKKALLPFLNNELFQSLTIICSHIMPWMERFVSDRNLEMKATRENMKYEIIISHKLCENCSDER